MNKVAVVILNYNGRQYLEQFLPSVVKYSKPHEVIIADNCSTDDSVEYLKSNYPSLEIIEIPFNQGYSAGYNYALQKVNSEYYILLNSDIEVTENWIDPVIESIERDNNVVAAQPKIKSFHEPEKFEYAGAAGGYLDKYGYAFCRGRIFETLESDTGQYDDEKSIFWATGACLFIKSNDFHELGGFDDRFFAHMEEIDLCWRINRTGKQVIYCPNSVIYHVGGGTLEKSNPKKTYLNFRNGLSMLLKNYSLLELFTKLPVRILLDWVAVIKFSFDSPKHGFAIVKAHIDAIGNLYGTIKRRKAFSRKFQGQNEAHLYNKSIVWQYFAKNKKYYSDL